MTRDAFEDRVYAAIRDAQAPAVALGSDDLLSATTSLTAGRARELFEDMLLSRFLDVAARDLRARGAGYYTISSAGHELNAVLGAVLRTTDPCLLHYRSGALMMARSRHRPDLDPVRDTLLSLVAAADDPIAGGRHKVWGSRDLWVPPQTSTIASHLPKAVGAAFALGRSQRLDVDLGVPDDSIVCCSFGDASANHATALAGINAARYAQRQGSPVPILFVCEDNGLGISVATPRHWVRETFGALPNLRYVRAGGEFEEVWDAVERAVAVCRRSRAPVFLHLDVVRLWGHAGSDVERGYRTTEDIEADLERDPLSRTARRLVEYGVAADDLRATVDRARRRVATAADAVAGARTLDSREEIVAPLAPFRAPEVRRAVPGVGDSVARLRAFQGNLPEDASAPTKRTLAAHLNAALVDEMLVRPEMLVFGEDVARKGGVYHVTARLHEVFGQARVFDTLLDETTVLGTAQGAAMLGLLPVPEIQYLAYLHNALDQIRGEAASLGFFSQGQFTNPMVVRIASFAYQKGFGGHFHNDNSIGALRDIPGLVVAAPARGDDAARMLRGSLALAETDGRVVAFLEPIALYHERDLHDGDGGWLSDYPPQREVLLPGEVGVHHVDRRDVLIVTYANGLRWSLRAARRLAVEHGIGARVLDLRWLNPLPFEAIEKHAAECGAVVVADECRATGGGIADAVIGHLAERGYPRRLASVRSADSFVPLGPAADLVLLSEADIVAAVRAAATSERSGAGHTGGDARH